MTTVGTGKAALNYFNAILNAIYDDNKAIVQRVSIQARMHGLAMFAPWHESNNPHTHTHTKNKYWKYPT